MNSQIIFKIRIFLSTLIYVSSRSNIRILLSDKYFLFDGGIVAGVLSFITISWKGMKTTSSFSDEETKKVSGGGIDLKVEKCAEKDNCDRKEGKYDGNGGGRERKSMGEEIVPESDRKWMIALGWIIAFMTSLAPSYSFTIVFGDFLNETGKAGSITMILDSISSISFTLTRVGTSLLLKIFPIRTVGVIGAIIFAIPSILEAFVNHIVELEIIFFLHGIGCGLFFTVCDINFNTHFVKRRATMVSVCSTIVDLGCIVYPICVGKMMKTYGYRGTALLNAGISLHCIVGMAMMHPIKRHSKQNEGNVISEEVAPLMEEGSEGNHLPKDIDSSMKSTRWNCLRSLDRDDSNSVKEKTKKEKNWSFSDLVDMDLMMNRSFVNTCVVMSFFFVSDYTFTSFLPLMMIQYGYTKSDAALAITVGSTTELVSKILLAIVTFFVDIRPRKIFFVAMICMAFAKIGFYHFEHSFIGLITMAGVTGVVRSWLGIQQSLVIVEDMDVDRFAAAYGLYSLISGIISVIFGPLVGFIKDWTDSFDVCQLVLIGLNVITIVPFGMGFCKGNARNTPDGSKIV